MTGNEVKQESNLQQSTSHPNACSAHYTE